MSPRYSSIIVVWSPFYLIKCNLFVNIAKHFQWFALQKSETIIKSTFAKMNRRYAVPQMTNQFGPTGPVPLKFLIKT